MSYHITEDCISCGICESQCPNQAIFAADSIYIINAAKCTECVCTYLSSRCAQVCPVNACQPDLNRKESSEQLFKKWLLLHPNDDLAKYLSSKYKTDY